MKLTSLKSLLVALGFVACLFSTTSCNRGYGCPTDFSVEAVEIQAPMNPSC